MPKGVASHIVQSSVDPRPGPGAVGLRVDSNKRPRIIKTKPADGTLDSNIYNLQAKSVRVITASTTLTAADDGAMVVFDSTATLTVTLPATVKNLTFEFYVKTIAASGVGHSISPAAADKIYAPGFTATDDKDAINTQTTAAIGDAFKVVGDGAEGWFGYKEGGTWNRE